MTKRFRVLTRDNYSCRYCGAGARDAKLTIDHVVPKSHGGTNDESNLVTACGRCNQGKGSTPSWAHVNVVGPFPPAEFLLDEIVTVCTMRIRETRGWFLDIRKGVDGDHPHRKRDWVAAIVCRAIVNLPVSSILSRIDEAHSPEEFEAGINEEIQFAFDLAKRRRGAA